MNIPIRLSNVIRIRAEHLPGGLREIFNQRLIFRNPLHGKTARWGKPVAKEIPATLEAIWEESEARGQRSEVGGQEGNGTDVVIAKGYLEEVIRLCHAHRFTPEMVHERPTFDPPPYQGGLLFESSGLNGDQAVAIREMREHSFGILSGIPGTGKRLCALKLAIRAQLPMLVIVQTIPDLHQWRRLALSREHGIEEAQVGLLGDGHSDTGRPITIAIAASLWRNFDKVGTTTGLLVIDRCDHASLSTIFKTRFYTCQAMWGLASGPRQDGLTKLMEAYIGPRCVQLQNRRPLPSLRIINTEFEFEEDESTRWEDLLNAMAGDEARNNLIAIDILEAAARDKRCVVLSDRTMQLDHIVSRITERMGPEVAIVSSKAGDLESTFNRFNIGKLRVLAVLLRSVPLLDPVRHVDCFFVVAPIRQIDFLLQVIAKMGNGGLVVEYRDRTRALRFSLGRRMRVYRRMGIK